MFKSPQGMLLAGNVAAASAAASAAAATSAATAYADKTKMCASSLIFKAIKWYDFGHLYCYCFCTF